MKTEDFAPADRHARKLDARLRYAAHCALQAADRDSVTDTAARKALVDKAIANEQLNWARDRAAVAAEEAYRAECRREAENAEVAAEQQRIAAGGVTDAEEIISRLAVARARAALVIDDEECARRKQLARDAVKAA